MNLVPAYGVEYHSKEQVLNDWESGIDFRLQESSGTYTSIRDFETLKKMGTSVNIIWDMEDPPIVLHNREPNILDQILGDY